ncbi:MAG: MBL fold metallo-hydrolase [Desulfobacteraceae bacterium]
MRFSVLASGSSGNACYVETAQTRILIDAGLSCRELMRRLELVHVDPKAPEALVITHEHVDHMRGAGPLARLLDIPVYINSSTFRKSLKILGNLSKPMAIHTGQTITIKDLAIETFTKCHDTADPMGLVLSSDGARLGLITDLGRSTQVIEDRLRGCHALIIEFNHDQRMLEDGPYPWEVKRRIKGSEGHLSNRQAGELLAAVAHKDLGLVILAHLSRVNNNELSALKEAKDALTRRGLKNTKIVISRQDYPLSMAEL